MTENPEMRIGRYRLLEQLGSGGMSKVYRAEDTLIGRMVALKVLVLPPVVTDAEREEMVLRFEREARSAGRLSHINVVTLYEVSEADDQYYIAMELFEGKTLRQVMDAGRISPRETMRIVQAVASALDYAHTAGVVHRDVKPDNIALLETGQVKLTDFGIARLANDLVRTQAGIMVGSPAYMSPEQITSEEIDGRSDVFALATTTWEMLCGHKPFDAPNVAAVLHKIVYEDPEPNPGIPEVLYPVFRKAFAKDPANRYQKCRAFAEELGLKLVTSGLAGGDMFRQAETQPRPTSQTGTAPASRGSRSNVIVPPWASTSKKPASGPKRRIPVLPAVLITLSLVVIVAMGVNAVLNQSGPKKRNIELRPVETLAPVAMNHVLSDFEISTNNWQMATQGFELKRLRSKASQGSYWMRANSESSFETAVIALVPEQKDWRKFGNAVAIDVLVPNEADTDCFAQLFIVDAQQRRHPLGQADRLRPGEWGSLQRVVDERIMANVQQFQLEIRPTNRAVTWFGIDHLRVFRGQ